MIDPTKIQMSSKTTSLKILKEGNGAFTVPNLPGAGDVFGIATIPHGYISDNLLYQVSTTGGQQDNVVLPWQSNDGRVTQYAKIDNTNLYIVCIDSDSSGLGHPGRTINYSYRILVP